MSDDLQRLITAGIVALGLAILDRRAKARHKVGEERLDKIEHNTNSLVDKLVKKTSKESYARGRKSKTKTKPRQK